jgi:hypothetical protein
MGNEVFSVELDARRRERGQRGGAVIGAG